MYPPTTEEVILILATDYLAEFSMSGDSFHDYKTMAPRLLLEITFWGFQLRANGEISNSEWRERGYRASPDSAWHGRRQDQPRARHRNGLFGLHNPA
jgi:hypothetical protein